MRRNAAMMGSSAPVSGTEIDCTPDARVGSGVGGVDGDGDGAGVGVGADAAGPVTATASRVVAGNGEQVTDEEPPIIGTATVRSEAVAMSFTLPPADALTMALTVTVGSNSVSFVPAASRSGPGLSNSISPLDGKVTLVGVDVPLNVADPEAAWVPDTNVAPDNSNVEVRLVYGPIDTPC